MRQWAAVPWEDRRGGAARRPAIHGLAALTQMGVEIHLHQDKPEYVPACD
jgi:hypothetical protein